MTLLEELENAEPTDGRRLEIGERLAETGDTRPVVGEKDGIPEMVWLPVAPGGKVKII